MVVAVKHSQGWCPHPVLRKAFTKKDGSCPICGPHPNCRPLSMRERIERNSIPEPNTGCWIWLAWLEPDGYGALTVSRGSNRKKKRLAAHRESYKAFVGPIAQGLTIDHLCMNKWCVNPDHLETVTRGENARRGGRKVCCKCGHVEIQRHRDDK